MRVAIVNSPFLWKIITQRLLRNASLQSAFDRIACQVISAVVVAVIQQGLGFFDSNFCQALKIKSSHLARSFHCYFIFQLTAKPSRTGNITVHRFVVPNAARLYSTTPRVVASGLALSTRP